MLLAMFVAGTTKSFSQNMNKRTEETPQSVIANVHKAVDLLKEKGARLLMCFPTLSQSLTTGMLISSLLMWIKAL